MEVAKPASPILPAFNEQDLQTLRHFYTINEKYQPALNKKLAEHLQSHPVWGPLLRQKTPEQREADNKHRQQLQRAAIFEGRWEEYTADLIRQGRSYAQQKVRYSDWYEVVTYYKVAILPLISTDFAHLFAESMRFMEGLIKFSDYTMYVIAEAYFQEKNSELESKVAERTRELHATNKELEAFSYSVSHDLRAPIRAINGYAGILEEDYAGRLDKDGMQVLNAIKANSKRMGELIDDLLAFSRLARKQVTFSDLNMNAIVRTVSSELLNEQAAVRVQLHIDELLPAVGDSALIKQVWQDLFSNALKFSRTREQAEISISSVESDGQVTYHIRDNGVGFDMAYYDTLFGVFQRLHSEEEFEGSGIGLAIVQRIIQRHGGRVWAEARPGEGACFSFTLPKIDNQAS